VKEKVTETGNILVAMMANEAMGARHLADNKAVAHYDEGPAEKLERWLKSYQAEKKKRTEKELASWVAGLSKNKNSKLGQILNCTKMRGYLEDLEEFSLHFMVDTLYGQAFCMEFLHNMNGGVSGSNV